MKCPNCNSSNLARGNQNLWCRNCGYFPIYGKDVVMDDQETNVVLDSRDRITQDEIMQLAISNPLLYAVFAAMKNPIEDWEQAMMRCVFVLHHENEDLKKQMVNFANYHGLPNPAFLAAVPWCTERYGEPRKPRRNGAAPARKRTPPIRIGVATKEA